MVDGRRVTITRSISFEFASTAGELLAFLGRVPAVASLSISGGGRGDRNETEPFRLTAMWDEK